MRNLFILAAMLCLFVTFAAGAVTTSEVSSQSRLGRTMITGTLYDSDTRVHLGEGIPVSVYCKRGEITYSKNVKTSKGGIYSAMFVSAQCAPGDKAWNIVNSHKSKEIDVDSGDLYDHASVNSFAAGVPEFSTITMGAAVVAGGLGFILLRKKN